MKNYIIQACESAIVKLDKQTPITKKQERYVSIVNVNPTELGAFMEENSVPRDAWFSGRDNGYDSWDDVGLSWDIDVPTTEEYKMEFRRNQFGSIVWQYLYPLLTTNGYKRRGCDFRLFKAFDDTNMYDMYMEKDFNRIEEYYSLMFSKISE